MVLSGQHALLLQHGQQVVVVLHACAADAQLGLELAALALEHGADVVAAAGREEGAQRSGHALRSLRVQHARRPRHGGKQSTDDDVGSLQFAQRVGGEVRQPQRGLSRGLRSRRQPTSTEAIAHLLAPAAAAPPPRQALRP